MCRVGVAAVRFGEFSWSWFEPREGASDFAAYDRLADLCHDRGLKLVVRTPTATLDDFEATDAGRLAFRQRLLAGSPVQ